MARAHIMPNSVSIKGMGFQYRKSGKKVLKIVKMSWSRLETLWSTSLVPGVLLTSVSAFTGFFWEAWMSGLVWVRFSPVLALGCISTIDVDATLCIAVAGLISGGSNINVVWPLPEALGACATGIIRGSLLAVCCRLFGVYKRQCASTANSTDITHSISNRWQLRYANMSTCW